MSRDIKFRGFYKFNGNALYPKVSRWIYGYLTIENEVTWIKDIEDITMSYCVSSKSVGQFTGLHDKNSKEIYEGDIYQVPLEEGFQNYHGTWCRNEIINLHGTWVKSHISSEKGRLPRGYLRGYLIDDFDFDAKSFLWDPEYSMKTNIEVIGNIYENPEMIK